MSFFHQFVAPGFKATVDTVETQVWRGGRYGDENLSDKAFVVASSAVDAGNSPTTTLRGGIIMAYSAAGNVNTVIPVGQAAAAEFAVAGILPFTINMLDYLASAENRNLPLLRSGYIYTSELLTGLATGGVSELLIQQLNNLGFIMDDQELHGRVVKRQDVVASSVAATDVKNLTRYVLDANSLSVTLPEIVHYDTALAAGKCYEGTIVEVVAKDGATGGTVATSASQLLFSGGAIASTAIAVAEAGPGWRRCEAVRLGLGTQQFGWLVAP